MKTTKGKNHFSEKVYPYLYIIVCEEWLLNGLERITPYRHSIRLAIL